MANDRDYDWEADAYGCWKLAIHEQRMRGIREGRFEPRPDNAAEVEAAKQAKGDGDAG